MRNIAVSALNFYRKYLSAMNLRCCRFYPTCSEYAVDAIKKYGVFRGGLLSAWRVLRCNPFSKGGYDPVR
jgi:putative membrane protein insertion efficiency factor